MQQLRKLGPLLFAWLFVAALCRAQSGRTELFGAVEDPAGLAIPNAKVEAEDQRTLARYASITDARGEYHILGLPAGEYVLTVERPGFRTSRQSGIAASYTAASQFVIGNSTRNPVRGPGLQNADLMLGKTFRSTERLSLEFRAEAFNISNTPPLNDPSGSFGSAAFGSITRAGNPRVFEPAGKVHF